MKVVVFAHVPPPVHGQSYMVRTMLDGLSGNGVTLPQRRDRLRSATSSSLQVYHVDARISDRLERVGRFKVAKLFRLLGFCFEAIWYRLRYGAEVLYYVPAPPQRTPFLRDCLVLLLCRPFFRRLILHWHATGLTDWLQSCALPSEHWLATILYQRPDLSIVLGDSLARDATYFASRQVRVVPNGILDPCPDFEVHLQLVRQKRLSRIAQKPTLPSGPKRCRVLFLAHCTRAKGLFDTLEAVAMANQHLESRGRELSMHLTVAGAFSSSGERARFDAWMEQHPADVELVGFADVHKKATLLKESDCLCFPSYYAAETQPVAIIEAMAFGLTVVATCWRGIPEMLPQGYPHLVPIRDPTALAEELLAATDSKVANQLRARFFERFTNDRYISGIQEAFRLVAVS